jgi:hypothetical protein
VIGKVCHVGKFSFRCPRGRDFVAIAASEGFVFVGRVKERGIF